MQDTVSKITLAVVAVACIIAVIIMGGASTTAARLVDVVLVAVGALGGGLAQSLLRKPTVVEGTSRSWPSSGRRSLRGGDTHGKG